MFFIDEIRSILLTVLVAVLTGIGRGYTFVQSKWIEYKYADANMFKPQSRYYLTEDNGHTVFDESHVRVPENCVYIEEWVDVHGYKKCVVRYQGDEIPTKWAHTPFDVPAKCPWVWVGDRGTEIDLTRTFSRFLVVGNVITLDLVMRLIRVTDRSNLIYIQSGTFNEIKFPGSGITIVSDVD
jgi:hypothetical protein